MNSIREFQSPGRVQAGKLEHANLSILTGTVILFLVLLPAVQSNAQQPIYLDSSKPVAARVDDLLQRMTLKEKIGQMNMPCSYLGVFGKSHEEKLEFARRFTQGTLREDLGPGGGFFTLTNSVLDRGTRQQAERYNRKLWMDE